jgi:NAD(P)-dependent dehydrogenase (short-subunit alcohol dehydrogenase family)
LLLFLTDTTISLMSSVSVDDHKLTSLQSGIGEALTKDLLGRGWRIAVFDIQDDLGDKFTQELGDNFLYVHCELTNYEEQGAAFQKVFDKWGKIDAFCHNAGLIDQFSVYKFGYRGKTEYAGAIRTWSPMLIYGQRLPPKPNLISTETCYHGLIYGTQLAIHFMRQNPVPGGQIVATGSSVGVHPIESMPEYCGAKAAINVFVQGTARVLQSVSPSFSIDTHDLT